MIDIHITYVHTIYCNTFLLQGEEITFVEIRRDDDRELVREMNLDENSKDYYIVDDCNYEETTVTFYVHFRSGDCRSDVGNDTATGCESYIYAQS